MKKNRSSVIALLLLMVFISIVHAQQAGQATPEQIATKTTEWMKTNLNLNEDQTAQVHDVNLKYATRNMDLKKSSMGRRQKLQTLKANEDAKDKELKRIFTADQYKIWEVKKEEIKELIKEKAKKNKGQ
jgi:hypothetical protein